MIWRFKVTLATSLFVLPCRFILWHFCVKWKVNSKKDKAFKKLLFTFLGDIKNYNWVTVSCKKISFIDFFGLNGKNILLGITVLAGTRQSLVTCQTVIPLDGNFHLHFTWLAIKNIDLLNHFIQTSKFLNWFYLLLSSFRLTNMCFSGDFLQSKN